MDRNIKLLWMVWAASAVALRKESVDRNALGGLGGAAPQGRSPQGERG